MKKVIEKVFGFEINKKLLAVGMVLVTILLIVPVARIMLYCIPWYDDFGYGKWVKNFWELRHSVWDALQGAVASAKSSYYAWQGTFSSIFMMSLMPAIWGTDKYVYGLWFVLLMFVAGIFFIVRVLLVDVLKADKWSTLMVQALVIAACVVLFHSPIEGLFWYDAAVHYTAIHGMGLMVLAMLIKMIYTRKKALKIVLLVASMLLGAFVGGGNYVSILQMLILVLSILGWGLIFKKKSVLWAAPAAVCMGITVYLNMTAPGNNVRMAHFVGMRTSSVEAILNSFKCAFIYADDFTGWMTLAVMILLVPVTVQIVTRTSFRFRYPLLVLVWSLCVYATGFTPTLFTMGHVMLSRATSMTKFTFQLLLFFNEIYLIGWGCQYLRERRNREIKCKHSLCFYVLMVLVMLGIFAAEPNKGRAFTTYVSYYFVHTGEAYNYYQEYLERVELCESAETDVVLRPFVYKPWVLCLGDLTSDPDYEPNRFMADYFGKNSIVCLSEEEERAMQEEQAAQEELAAQD